MKTVMKKLFSLMLVAALLVSAIPAAFADGEVTCPQDHEGSTVTQITGSKDKPATCTETGIETYKCSYTEDGATKEHVFEVEIPVNGHTSVADPGKVPTCTETGLTAGTRCSVCGAVLTGLTELNKAPHDYDADGYCKVCTICQTCGQLKANCVCCDSCTGYEGHHAAGCIENCTGERDCDNLHHKSDCQHALCNTEGCEKNDGHTGEHTGVPCSATDCSYYLGHAGKHSYQCTKTAGCQLVVGHTGNCSDVPEEAAPGKSTLTVYANLITGGVKTETIKLIEYKNLSSDTLVYPYISARMDQINSLLPGDYVWSGNVHDAENDRDGEVMNARVGSGRTVYINAYTSQDYVYIYVHNSRSYSNLRVIQLDGKKAGDTVTRAEVKKAVSKYYSLSSLSMYTEKGWEAYVQKDETAQSVDTVTVEGKVTEIHVKISGSAKSSSATADSSNPKTGDAIFTPVMVLGVSASALAVLFYLNKKRAF